MVYKIKNDFSPIVCPPKVVMDKEVTMYIIAHGNHSEVHFGEPMTDSLEMINSADKNVTIFKEVLTDEIISVHNNFIMLSVAKRFLAVDFDMTANHNFGKIRHDFYTLNLKDDYEIVSNSNIRVEDYEKPHLVGITYGNDEQYEFHR